MLNEATPVKTRPPTHSNRLRKKLRQAYTNENNPYSDFNITKRSNTSQKLPVYQQKGHLIPKDIFYQYKKQCSTRFFTPDLYSHLQENKSKSVRQHQKDIWSHLRLRNNSSSRILHRKGLDNYSDYSRTSDNDSQRQKSTIDYAQPGYQSQLQQKSGEIVQNCENLLKNERQCTRLQNGLLQTYKSRIQNTIYEVKTRLKTNKNYNFDYNYIQQEIQDYSSLSKELNQCCKNRFITKCHVPNKYFNDNILGYSNRNN